MERISHARLPFQYSVSVDEMVFTMIAGVVAVTFIAFVFIPHWTGAVLVCPLIIILYINMLGKQKRSACSGHHGTLAGLTCANFAQVC